MSQWDYMVIIYDTVSGGGYQAGKVRYPNGYKDQDVNQVLSALGQGGWEIIISHEGADVRSVITLKRQKA
jgi:hypothetical protein